MSEVLAIYSKQGRTKKSMLEKLELLLQSSKIEVNKGDLVAIKTHLGQRGLTTNIRPQYLRTIVDFFKEKNAKPFITDTTTLYPGGRANAIEYYYTAMQNGFTQETMNCPIIIADGIMGNNVRIVKIDNKEYEFAGEIIDADLIISASHFKGHPNAGFGGAMKNLGMGCAGKKGKMFMHSSTKPKVNEKCTSCGLCIKWCKFKAISFIQKKAFINNEKCVSCGACYSVCPENAISYEFASQEHLQESIAEYTYALCKEKKYNCINFLIDITHHCDCFPFSDIPIISDIGILSSRDVVAIDKASLDLVNKAVGINGTVADKRNALEGDKFGKIWNIDSSIQLRRASELGLGSLEYKIREVA